MTAARVAELEQWRRMLSERSLAVVAGSLDAAARCWRHGAGSDA